MPESPLRAYVKSKSSSMAVGRLRHVYEAEYHTLMEQMRGAYPDWHRRRNVVTTILRHRHREKWDQLYGLAVDLVKREVGYIDGRRLHANASKVKWKPEREYACPHCGSPKGRPCRAPSGSRSTIEHAARRALVPTKTKAAA